MPTFTYQTPSAGEGGADYKGLHNKKVTLRYAGFRMDSGVLWTERRLDDNFRFSEQDGGVIRIRDGDGKLLASPVAVPAANVAQMYINQVQLDLCVIKPLTHYDTRMSVRLKVKGLNVVSANAFSFTSNRTGFMKAVIACGFNWRLVDTTSEYHDPSYVLDRMEANCTTPLSVEQIILGVVGPILQEAADNGRLVEGKTGADNAWFQWDTSYGYLDAIADPVVLEQIWKEVEGHKPDDEEVVTSPETGEDPVDQEVLKAAIMQAKDGEVKSALVGDPSIVPNPRVNEIYELILQSEPGFKKGPGMLSRIKDSTLVAVHEAIFVKEEEVKEEEAAL